MLISNLPKDLVEEIFSRIPSKFMGVVRSTCRAWDTICRNRNFAKTSIEKAFSVPKEGESPMIMLIDYNLYLTSVVFDVVPSIETKCRLTCFDEQVKISQVYSCEGLLLCVLKEEDTTKYRLVVWNPYWGQTRWIESSYKMSMVDKYKYALGYVNRKNKSCRSHRILRFYDDPVYRYGKHENQFSCEIYDFDSGLWTTLDVTPSWRISSLQRGVSLNGNTYWCARERKSRDGFNDHIICFDFTRMRFGPLLPLPFSAKLHKHVNLSCVREEKLAVSLQHNQSDLEEINIWMTTKIEAGKVSWRKFLKMDMGPDFGYLPISPGDFFINKEKKVVMGFYGNYLNSTHNRLSFIGEGRYFEVINLGERVVQGCRSSMCPYVPSLVQINQPAGGKRKKLLDMRQFDLKKKRKVESCTLKSNQGGR